MTTRKENLLIRSILSQHIDSACFSYYNDQRDSNRRRVFKTYQKDVDLHSIVNALEEINHIAPGWELYTGNACMCMRGNVSMIGIKKYQDL